MRKKEMDTLRLKCVSDPRLWSDHFPFGSLWSWPHDHSMETGTSCIGPGNGLTATAGVVIDKMQSGMEWTVSDVKELLQKLISLHDSDNNEMHRACMVYEWHIFRPLSTETWSWNLIVPYLACYEWYSRSLGHLQPNYYDSYIEHVYLQPYC